MWILLLFWTLNGEPVLNYQLFNSRFACEERKESLQKVFDIMHNDSGEMICKPFIAKWS